jgi:triosephosphate isomerase
MSKKITKALIGGNWKCNGTVASVKSMITVLNNAGPFSPNSEVVIAVPSIHLSAAKGLFRPDIAVSAEDVGFKKGYGAFTGEISAEMLVDSGIKWTLTGHSERRVGFGFPVIIILIFYVTMSKLLCRVRLLLSLASKLRTPSTMVCL